MTAQIINGKEIVELASGGNQTRGSELTAQGIQPGLVVVIVGEDRGFKVYVSNKAKACEKQGFIPKYIVYRRNDHNRINRLDPSVLINNRNPWNFGAIAFAEAYQ